MSVHLIKAAAVTDNYLTISHFLQEISATVAALAMAFQQISSPPKMSDNSAQLSAKSLDN